MKKKEHTAPPDFVTVTCIRTVDWIYNDSTQFVKGNEYSLPSHVYQTLAKYFTTEIKPKEIKDGE